jgi:hypothetical protein
MIIKAVSAWLLSKLLFQLKLGQMRHKLIRGEVKRCGKLRKIVSE